MFKRMTKKESMIALCAAITSLSLAAIVSAQTGDHTTGQPTQLPAGHPQTGPQMPSGHPEGAGPSFKPVVGAVDRPEAKVDDVKSVDSIIKAYYGSISGPKGQAREWDRMRSLFMAGGRYIAPRISNGKVSPVIITPEEFVKANRRYFEGGGYFENEIHRTVNQFGNVANVFSTYESKHAKDDTEAYSRGINSIQLMKAGGRWWITSIMWDYENGQADHEIPLRYLPEKVSVKSEESP